MNVYDPNYATGLGTGSVSFTTATTTGTKETTVMDPATIVAGVGAATGFIDDLFTTEEERTQAETSRLVAEAQLTAAQAQAAAAATSSENVNTIVKWGALAVGAVLVAVLLARRR